MEDLNPKKSSTLSIIPAVILALLLGFGAYTYTKKKTEAPAPSEVTQTEEATPAPADTATAPAEPAAPVVVETKKLPIASPEVPPPSASNSDPKIVAMMSARSIGEASAPVKVIEYSSLTCPHCATFHREGFAKFKSEFIDTGKVQITFKEFPLNQPAMDASQILRCMPEDKYVSFMNLLFQEQDKWAFDANYKEFLKQNAKLAGMSDAAFDECLANDALKAAIVGDMKAAGDTYKVQSTPSFVFNHSSENVLVGNQPIEEFAKAVSKAGGDAVTSAPASAPATPPEVAPESTPAPAAQENAPAAAADAAVDASGAEPVTDEEAPPAE